MLASSPSPRRPSPRWWLRAIVALVVWASVIEPEGSWRRDHGFAPTAHPWPAGCDGVRVAVVGDLHIGDPHMHAWRLGFIRRQLAQARPDLIVMPGDFVAHVMGGHTLPMATVADRLADWPALAPTVAVLGNHDYSDAPADLTRRALAKHGIVVLDNQATRLRLRGGACELWIAGVGDGFSGLDRMAAALAEVPSGQPVVLLSHDPRVALKADPDRVAWVVAGHAHGGVACVPGTLWCLSRWHPWTKGWVRGWYHPPGRPPVLVTPGLGNSIYPGRFGAPPGWDLVTLNAPPPPRVSR